VADNKYMEYRITVAELESFIKSSSNIMQEDEIKDFIDYISLSPKSGDIIPDTGGIRKVRWKVKDKGKRSGVRVIYFYYNQNAPLFLLHAYAKNEETDLSSDKKKIMKNLVNEIINIYKV
jgi:hypothetical protein